MFRNPVVTLSVCAGRKQLFLVFQQLLCVCVSAVVLNNLPPDGINKSSGPGTDGTAPGAEERRLPEGELLLQVGEPQAPRGRLGDGVFSQMPDLYARPLSTAGKHLSDQRHSGD